MDTKYGFGIAPASMRPALLNSVGALVSAGALLLTLPAEAKSPEKVLYSFCSQTNCTDGSSPAGGLLADSSGNFYGVTGGGGAHGNGAVFELAPDGTATVLYSFCSVSACADGNNPNTGVIPVADGAGNLYGTTIGGGSHSGGCSSLGCGVVWKLAPSGASWTESVLYTFTGGKDGDYPLTGLTIDAGGNLYGTTLGGGRGDCFWQQGSLTAHRCGTLFKIASDGTFSTVYRFKGGSDGANPVGTVIVDDNGNLYGTTLAGGTGACNLLETSGCGTVYEVSPAGKERQLYAFVGGNDGANPVDFGRGLLRDGAGNLYGTTYDGGVANAGTVFALAKDGTQSWLYALNGGSDGANPWSGVIADKSGNLYGTAQSGGTGFSGLAFEVASDGGSETVLYNFCSKQNCADGSGPLGELLADAKFRHLYSATSGGGKHGGGAVFSVEVKAAPEKR